MNVQVWCPAGGVVGGLAIFEDGRYLGANQPIQVTDRTCIVAGVVEDRDGADWVTGIRWDPDQAVAGQLGHGMAVPKRFPSEMPLPAFRDWFLRRPEFGFELVETA